MNMDNTHFETKHKVPGCSSVTELLRFWHETPYKSPGASQPLLRIDGVKREEAGGMAQ